MKFQKPQPNKGFIKDLSRKQPAKVAKEAFTWKKTLIKPTIDMAGTEARLERGTAVKPSKAFTEETARFIEARRKK
jgi:hypothetical protein